MLPPLLLLLLLATAVQAAQRADARGTGDLADFDAAAAAAAATTTTTTTTTASPRRAPSSSPRPRDGAQDGKAGSRTGPAGRERRAEEILVLVPVLLGIGFSNVPQGIEIGRTANRNMLCVNSHACVRLWIQICFMVNFEIANSRAASAQ